MWGNTSDCVSLCIDQALQALSFLACNSNNNNISLVNGTWWKFNMWTPEDTCKCAHNKVYNYKNIMHLKVNIETFKGSRRTHYPSYFTGLSWTCLSFTIKTIFLKLLHELVWLHHIGTSDQVKIVSPLPDMYAWSPRPYISGKSQVPMLLVLCITSGTLKIAQTGSCLFI